LVCGITSATPGEGRSTWIRLLAEAASLSGFRVLTVATRPSPQDTESLEEIQEQVHQMSLPEGDLPPSQAQVRMHGNGESTAVAKNVLLSPAEVTEKLTGPNSQPVVHIPLPGWVWNLERRKQWREALNHWRKIDNLVILVELPPASVPESILLGSNLPNLIWLSESGASHAAETKAHLQTLRDARCNLVGAVLNRDTGKSIKRRFSRWIGCFGAIAALNLSVGQAAEPESAPTQLAAAAPAEPARTVAGAPPNALSETNLYFSVVSPAQRAVWQQKLTLGPGDVLTFGLYGEPTLTKLDVFVRSDGRVDYLEATNVLAAGLTVDELRAKIDEELGKFRRAARTIIVPTQFRSKKYYVLGKVVQRGVYILDRPITVLEAITRAQGLENGLVDRNTIDIADLSRSFVMRKGQRIPVNFEKLFQSGDFSQNIPIEPEDYIFFPSTNIREVYVLGEVALPGIVPYTPNKSVVRAIAERGGFTEKAYKSRVLVVRGSVNNPETFVINTAAITSGGAPDFKLEPKDIVYVNYRPWSRAEDLLELALTGFLQAVVAGWVGQDVVRP
jgi:protein involved in polysaccharide export with SLBB domain